MRNTNSPRNVFVENGYAPSWCATRYAWNDRVNTPWLPSWLPWLPQLETPALQWLLNVMRHGPSRCACAFAAAEAYALKARQFDGRRIQPVPPPWGLFCCWCWRGFPEIVLHPPLHTNKRKRVHYYFHSNEPLSVLVPER